jgi:hypothetical protein
VNTHHYNHWLAKLRYWHKPKQDQWAFAFGQRAYYRYPRSWISDYQAKVLESHEEIHMEQFRRLGIVGFLWQYCVVEWNVPYREKSLEQEAFQRQLGGPS